MPPFDGPHASPSNSPDEPFAAGEAFAHRYRMVTRLGRADREPDKFWAAQKLMTLKTDLLRAAIRAGDFRDPKSEAFLARALAERRDAIGRAYLSAINPIVDPALDDDGVLTFRNAAVDADFAKAPGGYRAVWFRFDNATATSERIGETSGRTSRIEAPCGLPRGAGAFVKVQVSSVGSLLPSWEKPIEVFFRYRDGQWRLAGVDRMPEA